MVKQKVVVAHASGIVQKGLADILQHTSDVPVSHFVSHVSEVPLLARLKKSVLFIDVQWVIQQRADLYELKRNRNRVFLIANDEEAWFPGGSYEGAFLITDDLQAIQQKLAVIFPQQPKAVNGQSELTQRETEVLKLVARGRSNKEIAEVLSISLHTVISHRKNICRKLEIKTISGLTLYALINNLVS